MTKRNLWKGLYVSLYFQVRVRCRKPGRSWSRNDNRVVFWLNDWLTLISVFSKAQTNLLRICHIHSGFVCPHQSSVRSLPQTEPLASLTWAIPQLKFPLSSWLWVMPTWQHKIICKVDSLLYSSLFPIIYSADYIHETFKDLNSFLL